MSSVFDSASDFVVLEIVSWLLVFRGPSRKRKVRDVLSFGRTSRRFHSLVQSPELWTNLDVGALVREEKDEKNRLEIVGWFLSRRSMIVSCRSLWAPELDSRGTLDLIHAMPNLESVAVKFRDEKDMGQTIEAIESLGKLDLLRIRFSFDREKRVKPLKLPPTVHRLDIDAKSPVHGLLGQVPFRGIRKFWAGGDVDLPESLGALPEVEKLEIEKFNGPVSQRDIDEILRCHKLRKLIVEIYHYSYHDPGPLSFSGLEAAPCASLMTTFSCYGVVTVPRTCELVCRCCPNIRRFKFFISAQGEKLFPSDIVALASLTKLNDLSLSLWSKNDNPGEFSESFATLGQAYGAPAFENVNLHDFRFDPTAFFSSHRMTALKRLEFVSCDFPESSVRFLAASTAQTLECIDLTGEVDWMAPALLEGCTKVKRLILRFRSDDVLKKIGQRSIAPLKELWLFEPLGTEKATDAGLIGIAPALRTVEILCIRFSDISLETITRVVGMCPTLHSLMVQETMVKDLKQVIRPEIDIR